jgi:hypothetical protein
MTDEERKERQDEEEQSDEQAETDAEGHSARGHVRSEEPDPDDEGEEGKDEGRMLSDARLKADVEPIAAALNRLGAIGR